MQNVPVSIPELLRWVVANPNSLNDLIGSEFCHRELGWMTLEACRGHYLDMSGGTFSLQWVEQFFTQARVSSQISEELELVTTMERIARRFNLPYPALMSAYAENKTRLGNILRNIRDEVASNRSDIEWFQAFFGRSIVQRFSIHESIVFDENIGEINHLTLHQANVNYTGRIHVVYFDEYIPRRFRIDTDHEPSLKLLRFKEGDPDAVNFYADKVERHLRGSLTLCCAPSHAKGHWGKGLLSLVDILSRRTSCEAGAKLIARTSDTERRSQGGNRDAATNLASMQVVDPRQCRDKDMVVIDDIVTSGGTLCACAELLWQAGASSVACVTMGRTRSIRSTPVPSGRLDSNDEIAF